MKKQFAVLAMSVAALAVSGTAAADTLAKVKSSGSFTIGHRDASIPLSYYDDKQRPIGYSMDLCMKVVDAVKKELNLPKLEVKYQLVTSANRIPLLANGTVDIECGSTTNNAERQKQVSYLPTTFVTANRIVYKKNSGIKRVLLDQGLLSGIGNIYADESLWLAKLHYDKPASSITKRKHLELLSIAKDVLAKAVAQGGTTFDEQYKNVNGESGYFSQSLNAYGQTGLPCNRCGSLIKRDAWANRGSHYCPICQVR